MAIATKAKPEAPEEPTEEEIPEEKKSATIGDVNQIVADAVDSLKSIFTKPGAEGTTDELPAKPGKRPSYRDEEESMADLVSSKVAELIGKEKAQGENHPEPGEEKAPPEPIPAAPSTRRVEKFFGWS